jgi:hypothetical protein
VALSAAGAPKNCAVGVTVPSNVGVVHGTSAVILDVESDDDSSGDNRGGGKLSGAVSEHHPRRVGGGGFGGGNGSSCDSTECPAATPQRGVGLEARLKREASECREGIAPLRRADGAVGECGARERQHGVRAKPPLVAAKQAKKLPAHYVRLMNLAEVSRRAGGQAGGYWWPAARACVLVAYQLFPVFLPSRSGLLSQIPLTLRQDAMDDILTVVIKCVVG